MSADGRGGKRARAATAPSATDALIGRTLDGRYVIQEKIARGGMATVYLAHDNRLLRTVALKVMHSGLGDDETFSARFVREARSAAQLDHPNVVAVFDQGEDDGTLFLAMELVRGKTLRDLVGAPMPPAKALAYLEPVLAALAAAHRAGIVHRDVKPENVLISPASPGTPGRIKVADFGLARAVTAETQHTSTGTIIGTVSYLAPELVERGNADARVDVYAAGVLLYELLTGTKPHQGETPIQVAYKHVHEDIPAPSAAVRGIPPYVDALVARATARNPDERFTDAGDFLRNLHKVARTLADGISDDPELTAALNLGSRLPEPTAVLSGRDDGGAAVERTQQRSIREAKAADRRKKRRGLFALILALLLLIGIAIGVGWWYLLGRYTHVPNVEGKPLAVAEQQLQSAGFKTVEGTPRWSSTDGAGEVAGTDPGDGSRVLPGATITVFPSLGREHHPVPNVVGQRQAAAQATLQGLHFKIGTLTQDWSDTIPVGSVIGTTPGPGRDAYAGSVINLQVSKGQQPITLGNYVKHTFADVQSGLTKLKLTVDGSQQQYDDTIPAGVIISQFPAPGTIVHHGDTVSFTVSKGPHLVQVPDVSSTPEGVDAATQALKAAGFKVSVQHNSVYFGLGYVVSQTPGGGAMAPYGSTVTIFIT
ncbi:serine/threonine protein kinase [Nocardioides baekrokdamisoli]|uniref:non-specific serine/threonine protein kinase n=1 Tax=Nocardioides baekrokdamisoli TaxID=1804624 RepID=A0A3G9IJG2_9ACTN|nr:Stk1 family PASTA domain-containing Ser/Thr kinase [Nocardioides baekrokdamisoli]BBH18312.1 serine/threonine protein kinase [Nocardioides baekrokdamisoli]